jgi:hypothetical protein
MESQLSVLLYSKYSSSSNNLMNMIQTSGIDFTTKFSLQPLCIDNQKVRARILKNTKIQATTVPCLLIIFPDGGIEKYDGVHVFEWVESVIRQYTPPVQPNEEQFNMTQEEEQFNSRQEVEQKRTQDKLNERKKLSEENRRQYNDKYVEQSSSRSRSPSPKHRRRKIRTESPEPESMKQKPKRNTGVTSIEDLDDLPSEEEDKVSDRYRSRKPIGRIMTNEGNYEENEELFNGSPPNTRVGKRSAVKTNDATSQKSIDIMTKAKEMAKGREESQPPPGHPANQKN